MIRPTNIYGCNGRARPTAETSHVAQVGWRQYDENKVPVRVPVYGRVQHSFTTECQYDHSKTDAKCCGCGHRRLV